MSDVKYCIVDLDGTLADLTHRLHLVRQPKPDWDLFYQLAGEDSVNEWCRILINAMRSFGYPVLLVSARPASITKMTQDWLEKHYVEYDDLILLRGEKDYTKDDDLKMAWLKEFGKEKILFVVDDRRRVVDMWRQAGLVCLQCYDWEEYKKPKAI
jgi:hypothetical protein